MSMLIEIRSQHFTLLSQKAIFWQEKKTLIVSDLHLGKAGHFRKHGIAISQESALKDLEKLHDLIIQYTPLSIIFLGDLFHSDYNKEWELFIELRNFFNHVQFNLVKGNHDIIKCKLYSQNNIRVYISLNIEGFLFCHEKNEKENCTFQFYGHIHPAIKISAKGKQLIKLPCFALKGQSMMLPAFGDLTGNYIIAEKDYDKIYIIGKDNVYELP